jgi:hypothetical protein
VIAIIIFLWFWNFAISWLNAWGCGKSWTETKRFGGMAHFMNWMGAIMSASGFTWCYTLLACFVGSQFTHTVDGKVVPYLTQPQVMAVVQAGYLLVIFPIIGSGIAITIHSWVAFKRNKSFGNAALASYNTFADIYNIYEATRAVPEAAKGLGKFFDSDDAGKNLVILIVIAALLGGILTTYTILTSTARSTARERALRYADRFKRA